MATPMVEFSRDGSDVVARMDTDLPHDESKLPVNYPFRWRCNSASEAELVRRYLQDRMDRAIENIRRGACREGWKLAKAKRAKATEFSSWFAKMTDGGCW